jgi:hypothetical protein
VKTVVAVRFETILAQWRCQSANKFRKFFIIDGRDAV